jgi:DNA-binding transcriptional ArsR family regulator
LTTEKFHMKLFHMSRPLSAESTYRAIADPIRRRILELLGRSELTPSALAQSFRVSRQTLTFHLHVLIKAGLVSQQRRGRQRPYRAHLRGLQTPAEWLGRQLHAAEARPGRDS